MIYLIGCTHFGHKNIVKLANRPFQSIDEMDDVLIQNWNRTVKAKDEVLHLGDFAVYSKMSPDYYLKKLNGKITTIRGNHDDSLWGKDYHEFNYEKRKVVLMHYPIHEWNGFFRGAVHFHAHTHSPDFYSGERRGNVCVDAINFTPISLDEAIARVTS